MVIVEHSLSAFLNVQKLRLVFSHGARRLEYLLAGHVQLLGLLLQCPDQVVARAGVFKELNLRQDLREALPIVQGGLRE